MARRTGRRVLVIGVGNAYRRDDGVGLVVARRLRAEVPERVAVREESGEGAALMAAWEGADTVLIIDAVHSGAAPGTVQRLDAGERAIPADLFHFSTHAVSVADAVELARALGQLPPRLVVYGIEGRDFEAGVGLSPEVEEAARQVVGLVLEEVERAVSSAPAGSHEPP
jgi:hydrogenase maturation protease